VYLSSNSDITYLSLTLDTFMLCARITKCRKFCKSETRSYT